MKIFLSIGAGPGMGLETAERFAREGYRIVLSARSLEKVRTLAQALQAKGYTAEARSVDAANAASVASLVQDVITAHGSIDVLHYNAAALRKATVMEQAPDTFNSDLAVNIGGALVSIQAALPSMTKQASGSILLTGGGFGFCPPPDFLSIGIGKAGIRALANGLFEDLKAKGVHIATVTVCMFVDRGSTDAKAVAEHFWTLHSQPKADWTWEIQHS
ncbi:MAG: SDR family oxidoreductase [Hyphomicrobium sp.]